MDGYTPTVIYLTLYTPLFYTIEAVYYAKNLLFYHL